MYQWYTQSTRSRIYDIFSSRGQKLERQVNIGQSQWQDDDSQWKEYVRHARKFDRTYKVSMIARNCPEELNRKALRDHMEITTSIYEIFTIFTERSVRRNFQHTSKPWDKSCALLRQDAMIRILWFNDDHGKSHTARNA